MNLKEAAQAPDPKSPEGHSGSLQSKLTAYLDACRAPFNKICQFSLPNSLQALVDLRWVHLTLDYVQNGYVLSCACFLSFCMGRNLQ